MRYEGRVFRPPSEARSLIVQATVGCSHNKCNFCDMYKEKAFHIPPMERVLEDLRLGRQYYRQVDKLFIADGDALIRRTEDWRLMLETIARLFPECRSVNVYGSPRSILLKSPEDLRLLKSLGLDIVYLGLESGNDEILARMNKGVSADQIIAAGQKVKAAGLRLSVTAISGLGGQALWREHARDTGLALSRTRPDFIGLLTLLPEGDTPLCRWIAEGSFALLSPRQILEETRLLVENLDAPAAVFRANHASNYLALAGTLNQDKAALLARLDQGLAGQARLKGEAFRGL